MDLRAITNLDGGRLQSQVPSATSTAPLTTVGNPAAPLAWDPGVRHPLRQRRTHTPVPHALPPLSPSPPLFDLTAEDARTQHKRRRPPRSFRASFSEDADADVGAGYDEGATDDEYEDTDGRPAFVSGPYPRSAREVAPRFSHPHNLRAHPPGVNTTRISAQPIYRVNSDRGGTRASTTTPHMARRRGRLEDDDSEEEQEEDEEDIQLAEERLRYRPRMRRRCSSSGSERGISLKLSLPDPAPKLARRCSPLSPPFPRSPLPNSTSLHLPAVPNPRHHPAASDETTQKQSQPTRLESLSPLVSAKPIKLRSPSVESITEWPEPPTSAPRSVQKTTVSPGSAQITASASVSTPDTCGAVMLSDSEMADETEHLRAQLGCPPGAPVGLRALADPPPGEKPNYPLPTLIKLAIYDSPRGRLTLQEIYQALEDRFEWFRQRSDELSWKNSIRHNLSLRKCFLKVQRPITEPGKGSYWMIDLTQGEGNKRVRKRNKKPTKSQLTAQAHRLPGQGSDTPRPAHYPHARQPIFKDDNQAMDCDDDYQPQAPPMQTNFITKTTGQPQPQHPRTLLPPRGAATMSLSPSTSSLRSHELPDIDVNIDPALRVPATPSSRSSKAPRLSHIPPSSPVQAQAQQVMLPRPSHNSPYHHTFLPHQQTQAQGVGQQRPQTTASTLQIPLVRASKSSLSHDQTNKQRTAIPTQQQQSPRQQAAQAPAHTPTDQAQARTPRLPPMRTLSQSPDLTKDLTSSEPAHTSPPPTSPPPTASGSPTSSPRPTGAGFVRFARAPIGFAPTLVFGESSQSASPSTPIRPLFVSDATHTPSSSSSSSSSSVATAPAVTECEGGGRRRFVPPPPRAGIEYVQREGGGLVTARRPSGRYDEYTVDWLGRLVRVNADGGGQ